MFSYSFKGSSRGTVANVWDRNIIVDRFKLQLFFYVIFRTNILRNEMNFLIPASCRLNCTITVYYKDGFGII